MGRAVLYCAVLLYCRSHAPHPVTQEYVKGSASTVLWCAVMHCKYWPAVNKKKSLTEYCCYDSFWPEFADYDNLWCFASLRAPLQ